MPLKLKMYNKKILIDWLLTINSHINGELPQQSRQLNGVVKFNIVKKMLK